MSRFAPYLGIIPAILLFAFVEVFSTASTGAPEAHRLIFSPTLSVLPTLTTETPNEIQTTPMPSISQKVAATVSNKKPSPLKNIKPAVQSPIATESASASINTTVSELSTAASTLKKSLVNILCTTPLGSSLKSISASGVLIDPKGIILTDAHVAQYFLLADHGVKCSIRSGSPAVDRYIAAPLFISPAWLKANSTLLSAALPFGTGEYDFALLSITGSSGITALSYPFPYVSLSSSAVRKGEEVTIGSYGAQTLDFSQIMSALFPTIASSSIIDAFTFDTTSLDVIELAGTDAAQEGSSGGGVIDESGNLIGLVTTSIISGPIEERTTHAISMAYVRAEFEKETGEALDTFLSRPLDGLVTQFAAQAPHLEGLLAIPLP